jgi:hypothetical protein
MKIKKTIFNHLLCFGTVISPFNFVHMAYFLKKFTNYPQPAPFLNGYHLIIAASDQEYRVDRPRAD